MIYGHRGGGGSTLLDFTEVCNGVQGTPRLNGRAHLLVNNFLLLYKDLDPVLRGPYYIFPFYFDIDLRDFSSVDSVRNDPQNKTKRR